MLLICLTNLFPTFFCGKKGSQKSQAQTKLRRLCRQSFN